MSLIERDKKLIWHPFTQQKTARLPIAMVRGEGAYLYDESGRRYIDGVSSWWVNLHGHAHPQLVDALKEQAKTLDHVLFAGVTHEPAVALAEILYQTLPKTLSRFFYSDNGSTAIEVALKLSIQYWALQGCAHKTLFLTMNGGYHGDTLGAMSVGESSGYHNAFRSFLFQVLTLDYPDMCDQEDDIEKKEQAALTQLETYLTEYSDSLAAFIVEPLVQGASGMRMCRPSFLNQVIARLRAHHILIIFDEVMTGFGRTGTLFALEQLDAVPDFLCLSKGITGGLLPLAVTVTTEHIYEAFLSEATDRAFMHGHSYTANPIACHVASVSFGLLQSSDIRTQWQRIHATHQAGLIYLQGRNERFARTRSIGTISAFDWMGSLKALEQQTDHWLKKGLLLRPIGHSIYILPPYCITPSELERVYEIIGSSC